MKVLVNQLEREKGLLDGTLRNMEWNLDQEAQGFHTAKSKLENAEAEKNKADGNYKQFTQRKQIL